MNFIIKIFTESPNATQVFYIIFAISIGTYTFLKVLPEEKGIKWASYYKRYDWNKYDVKETVRLHRLYAKRLLIYATVILVLSFVFGDEVAEYGIWGFFVIAFLLVVFGKHYPVKKD